MSSASPADRMSGDLGRLLLRWTIGILMLMHGLSKVSAGPGPVIELLRANDLPGLLGYGVYIGEVLAPVLLIVGLWTRAAALLVVINMVVAVALAHRADVFRLGDTGGWAIELQALYLLGAAAIALLGAGALSVGGAQGRWN